jgi:hypothetical protein
MSSDDNDRIKLDISAVVEDGGFADGAAQADKVAASFDKVNTAAAQANKSIETSAAEFAKLNQEALASGQAWLQGSAAADAAKDKAWALANGYKEVGGIMRKAGVEAAEGMKETAFATARAKQEIVVLGREITQGNFSRMPGTLSIIAQGLSPVALGVAAVTAAVVAGAYAWYEWGDSAGKAVDRAMSGLKAAQDAAAKSKHMDDVEKLADTNRKILSLEIENQSALETIDKLSGEERTASNNKKLADQILYLSQTRMANREHIANLEQDAAKLQASLDKSAETRLKKEESAGQKLLESNQRFNEQIIESEKDGFTKSIDGWVKRENELSAAADAGTITRGQYLKQEEQNQAALTIATNAEYQKRTAANDNFDAAAAAADARKKAARAQHLATQLASEQIYFEQIAAAANLSGMGASAREELRFQRALIDWEKRHNAAKKDHALGLKEEQSFQDALANIRKEHQAIKMKDEMAIANFSQTLRAGDFKDAMGMAETMTAGLATHSRAAFEINKIASLARATISGYQMIQAAATDGATWGGVYGGIIEGALAAAFVAANLDAINSTEFGGGGRPSVGGGGGIPSQATSPGVPVSQQPVTPPSTGGAQAQNQPVTVNIYNTGNLLSPDYIDSVVIEQIKDRIANADVTIIDPRSRQAQMLAAA